MNRFLRILLWPFSLVYGGITRARNVLYDAHLLKSVSFEEVKTICIGNLCAGGAGKTPHTEYILSLLEKKYRVATLSRGYKRKTSGFLEVETNTQPDTCGDEPLQMKLKFPNAFVAVDENRVEGVKKILAKNKPDVILLDDAYQHRKIKCSLNILLTEYNNLFTRDALLPAGRLRESKKGYLRADIIVVTKTPEYANDENLKDIIKEINTKPHQSLFFSYLDYGHPYYVFNKDITINIPQQLFCFSVLLVTGIANPKPMLTYLKEYAEELIHKTYADHHQFTQYDIEQIKKTYNSIENDKKLIITSGKKMLRALFILLKI